VRALTDLLRSQRPGYFCDLGVAGLAEHRQ
jgi:hypothetical protein